MQVIKTLKRPDAVKENIKEQFNNLNKIVLQNIATIRGLVQQSKSLQQIIVQLKDKEEEENREILESLQRTHQSISKTIAELITQTEKLFEVYQDLCEDCFRK